MRTKQATAVEPEVGKVYRIRNRQGHEWLLLIQCLQGKRATGAVLTDERVPQIVFTNMTFVLDETIDVAGPISVPVPCAPPSRDELQWMHDRLQELIAGDCTIPELPAFAWLALALQRSVLCWVLGHAGTHSCGQHQPEFTFADLVRLVERQQPRSIAGRAAE